MPATPTPDEFEAWRQRLASVGATPAGYAYGAKPGAASPTVPGTTSSYQGGIGPEALAGTDIAGLLNPPALFPDTSRQAAEVAAGRGIAGSGAAGQTATRMTEEERLKHIALGNQLLDSQTGRQSTLGITPIQQAQLNLQQQQADLARKYQEFYINRLNTPSITYSGGVGGRGGGPAAPVAPPPAYSNMAGWTPGSIGGGGGISFGGYQPTTDTGMWSPASQQGGQGGGSDLDAVLADLGLGGNTGFDFGEPDNPYE